MNAKPLLVATLCVLLCSAPLARSQSLESWPIGGYMMQAVAKTMGAGADASNRGYGFASGVSFLAGLCEVKEELRFTRSFTGGREYILIGAGDEDATDVDLSIHDADGRQIVADRLADSIPVVRFTPPRTGRYSLRLKLFSGKREAFCSVVILERNAGFNVPLSNLAEASARFFASCAAVNQTHVRLAFHNSPNEWAMFGQVFRPGGKSTINNLFPEPGDGFVVAVGDDNANDLDLTLLTRDGSVVRRDHQSTLVPVVEYDYRTRINRSVQTINHASDGNTFVLTAMMRASNR
ncbi:MAG: hypothetical protein AAGE65_01335 [Planctomycetota bacterium]